MSFLNVSMGATFRLRFHKCLLESLNNCLNLTEYIPVELRRIIFNQLINQEVRPMPTFVSAISALHEHYLDIYLFIGSESGSFFSLSGLEDTAKDFEADLKTRLTAFVPERDHHLLSLFSVTWQPNLLASEN